MEMLNAVQGEVVFFVEDGPLKTKLVDRYLEEDDAHAEIFDFELHASVRIRRDEGGDVPVFECRLETGDFQYQTVLEVGDLGADQITELMDRLRPLCPVLPKQDGRPGRNILRKKNGRGLLNLSDASKVLGLSPRCLKSLIPCSEIRVAEELGEKTIEEYYWEKDLVGRFQTLWAEHKQGRGYKREDVTFIAQWCCDGDMQWARDLIAEFVEQRTLCGN